MKSNSWEDIFPTSLLIFLYVFLIIQSTNTMVLKKIFKLISFCKDLKTIKQFLYLACQQKIIHSNSRNNEIIDLSAGLEPGVYEILDVLNNKSYYGESGFLFQRLEMHFRLLDKGSHHCVPLQTAYNEQNKQKAAFQIFVLRYGPEWLDVQKRVKCQDEFIELNKDRCYNITSEQKIHMKTSQIRKIQYKKKQYANVRAALKDTDYVQISRGTLLRYLKDPKISDVYYLEAENQGIIHGSIGIFGQKDPHPSVFFHL